MFEYIWADSAAKMYVYRHIKNLGCAQKYCLFGWMVFHNKFELSLQGHNIHTCFVSLFLEICYKGNNSSNAKYFLKIENSKTDNRFIRMSIKRKK